MGERFLEMNHALLALAAFACGPRMLAQTPQDTQISFGDGYPRLAVQWAKHETKSGFVPAGMTITLNPKLQVEVSSASAVLVLKRIDVATWFGGSVEYAESVTLSSLPLSRAVTPPPLLKSLFQVCDRDFIEQASQLHVQAVDSVGEFALLYSTGSGAWSSLGSHPGLFAVLDAHERATLELKMIEYPGVALQSPGPKYFLVSLGEDGTTFATQDSPYLFAVHELRKEGKRSTMNSWRLNEAQVELPAAWSKATASRSLSPHQLVAYAVISRQAYSKRKLSFDPSMFLSYWAQR